MFGKMLESSIYSIKLGIVTRSYQQYWGFSTKEFGYFCVKTMDVTINVTIKVVGA